mgnify:CR=1 FL=1
MIVFHGKSFAFYFIGDDALLSAIILARLAIIFQTLAIIALHQINFGFAILRK